MTFDAAKRQALPTGDGQDVVTSVVKKLREAIRKNSDSLDSLVRAGLTVPDETIEEHELMVRTTEQMIDDLEARVRMGEKKYGTRLRTNNGRDVLLDFYQELLDAMNYGEQILLQKAIPDDDGSYAQIFLTLCAMAACVRQDMEKRDAPLWSGLDRATPVVPSEGN